MTKSAAIARHRSSAERLVGHDGHVEFTALRRAPPHVAQRRGRDDEYRAATARRHRERRVRLPESHRLGEHRAAVLRDDGEQTVRGATLMRCEVSISPMRAAIGSPRVAVARDEMTHDRERAAHPRGRHSLDHATSGATSSCAKPYAASDASRSSSRSASAAAASDFASAIPVGRNGKERQCPTEVSPVVLRAPAPRPR